jgi:signal transduction histidine kinase
VALLGVIAAVVIQRLLWSHIPASPELLFYPAVLIAARFGGFGPGAVTVALSCLAMAYWFLPPIGSLAIATADDALDLAIFGAMGLTVVGLMSGMRSAMAKARAAWRKADDARTRLDVAYRAREEMLAIVSHDLRSPLASIVLSATQIRISPQAASEPAIQNSCNRIQRATRRMETLVRNLLDAATIDAGAFRVEPSQVEVGSLLEGTVQLFELLAHQKSIRLEAEVEGAGSLWCDRERVLQALENLVGNALKFVPKDGQVVLSAVQGPSEVVFEVRDSGPGIAADQLAHIFDRYWKGRAGGSGLGLYIAKAIVEAHGGRIWATSDGGTTIAFALPLDRRSAPAPITTSQRREAANP